ncbi:ATP-dependent chaperone ClpB [Candidatus Gottesmanbacteria bacterium RBG_16_52_11]|uniref:ATP-dependent chaperone ClpB n=1 Tax=Candidatus Gottesmanbacteria bacterium RBG_16_52_11 TaxID=1798374 RepID=A0A1F5YV28_9BACT|nr:MAG: ATP-dependent chaperone ClpB [Candidatus Gottesmanbacteria bacterium RBG_16_52_11]
MDARYEPPQESGPVLSRYTVDLTEKARQGKLDPVIGRNEEIRRVMQILARRTKNNPVLLGDPGVGKTAIVEGLSQRIVAGDVPSTLQGKQVIALDVASLVAGSAYRGEFEDRLKKVLREIEEGGGKYIVFMDELHTLVGAGAAGGSMDAANILKPALARGELHCVGATTVREYRQYIEKDTALERRFQPVYVDEPTPEDALSILRGIKQKYEVHHGIRITDDALTAAVGMSQRYIPDRYLPDKAIDLVDEAASGLKIDTESMPLELDELKRSITRSEIEKAALRRERTGKQKLEQVDAEIKNLKSKAAILDKRWQQQKNLIGQLQVQRVALDQMGLELEKAERETLLEKAAELKYGKIPEAGKKVRQLEEQLKQIPEDERLLREEVTGDDIARVVSRWTGIPVSRLLKSEAEKLVHLEDELRHRVIGQDEALGKVASAIRRNRAGIGEQDRPIGSFLFLGPTGVGKTETAKALAEYLFNDEKAIIRLDMSEYQEPHSVSRLIGAPPGYIGYDEGGQLTEAVRRKPYSVVLFDEIEKAHPQVFNTLLQLLDDGRLTDGRGRVVNFRNSIVIMTSNLGSDTIQEYSGKDGPKMHAAVMELVRKYFRPEFINRLDQIIVYRRLNPELLDRIVELQLAAISRRLAQQSITLQVTPAARRLLTDVGFDPVYGARPLRRAIQDLILDELALQMIEKKIQPGSLVKVDAKDRKMVITQPN